MKKSKLRFIVAATAALLAELLGPAFSGVAHAGPAQTPVHVEAPAAQAAE